MRHSSAASTSELRAESSADPNPPPPPSPPPPVVARRATSMPKQHNHATRGWSGSHKATLESRTSEASEVARQRGGRQRGVVEARRTHTGGEVDPEAGEAHHPLQRRGWHLLLGEHLAILATAGGRIPHLVWALPLCGLCLHVVVVGLARGRVRVLLPLSTAAATTSATAELSKPRPTTLSPSMPAWMHHSCTLRQPPVAHPGNCSGSPRRRRQCSCALITAAGGTPTAKTSQSAQAASPRHLPARQCHRQDCYGG